MKFQFVAIFIFALIFSSCKTQEQIQREQMVDNLSIQMKDSASTRASLTMRVQELEQRLSQVTGQVEESGQQQSSLTETRINDLENKLKLIEEQNQELYKKLESQTAEIKQQKEYLEKVLSTLGNITGKKSSKAKSLSPYEEAMGNYKKGRYKTAKKQLLGLMDSKRLKANQKARIFHNLGMISFMNKDNDKALVYFSKLYTTYPKSKYNANALLFMAKTFQRTKQVDQAKQTLDELINKFPKSKKVAEAKKLLKSL